MPEETLSTLDDAGPDEEEYEGLRITADVVGRLREVEGISGIHVKSDLRL